MKKEQEKTGRPKPYMTFRSGNVTATIWENIVEKDGKKMTHYNVDITKSFKRDENSEWEKTSSFFKQELVNVEVVLRKSMDFLYLTEQEE